MSSVSDTPREENPDSAEPTREFFNRYFSRTLSFPSSQVDAVIGFFQQRGFDKVAAASVATVLLEQAKLDGANVFELLENLEGFDTVRLNALVTAILNANRSSISKLGYKDPSVPKTFESRNIIV